MKFLSVFLFVVFITSNVMADTCPTPGEIADRKISRLYEWTVDENTTLKELLSVNQLYAVRIMNYGEYISCRYTTTKWPVTLDGKPLGKGCELTPIAGEWTSTDSGQLVCRDKEVSKCGFKFECDEVEKQPD